MKDEAFFVYGKKEISYFKAKDKRLGKVIDKVVHIERETIPDLFSALVHSIVGQQISTKDHSTHIAGLDKETLQTFGITFKKEEYIKVAAKKVVDGDLDIERLRFLSDNEVCKELVKLDGIGVWTAEMLLIFSMRRPNILSFGDLAILRGMRMVYHHRQISKKLFEKYKKRLSPYASVASLYFWAVAGGAVLEMKDYATKKRSLKR